MFEKESQKKSEEAESKFPNALSRDPFQEGGYTFLHRVFRTHFQTGEPVIISSGKNYFSYIYEPHHLTFADGISLIEGDDEESRVRFISVVNSFDLHQAFIEANIQRPT